MQWSYGITTVPSRKDDLFPRTLTSLARAGFDKPWIFVDDCSSRSVTEDYRYELEVTNHWPKIRTAANWTLALAEIYLRQPTAERYAIFQDDLVTYRNLREYLERTPYPKGGYFNLYTFPANEKLAQGRVGWYESNQRGRGAVALVFDRAGVLTLLGSNHLWDRAADPDRGWRSIDGGIVTAFNLAGGKEYVHSPSLVQHVGLTSSMGNRPHPQAPNFRGEGYDALRFLQETGQTCNPSET
jgi:hypothetical protein